ncbi:MAG: hypothetical protein M1834_009460 [Cirrosporium novae-zelandiae]|nr:MAG: hypothetical protein M1834_009460 [Cirrosporium novae-zelandiae]
MMMTNPTPPEVQPPSTRRKKRSKNGCLNCLAAKVKCSESDPSCARCNRLGSICEWRKPTPSLKQRRRGYGPLKRRTSFTPTPIQAREKPSLYEDSLVSLMSSRAPQYDSAQLSGVDDQEGCSTTQTRPLCTSPEEEQRLVVEKQPYTNEFFIFDQFAPTAVSADACQPAFYPRPVDVYHDLSTSSFVSASSIVFAEPECRALHHYQNVLAKGYTSKNRSCSTLDVIFRLGRDNPTIMHLILAASLAQLSQSDGSRNLWQCGKIHFQLGSQRLIGGLDNLLTDHSITMAAFWLVQFTFGIVWGRNGIVSMRQLSKAVAKYARDHRLFDLFSSNNVSPTCNISELSLLARFMVWFLYADVEAEFYNAGGEYSTLFCINKEIAKKVYQTSQMSLEKFYKNDYPLAEIADDYDKSSPLGLRFEVTLLLHEINRSVQQAATFDAFKKLEEGLEELQKHASSLQRAVDDIPHQCGRLRDAIDAIQSLYYAVRIYNIRCLLPSLVTVDMKEQRKTYVQALLERAQRVIVYRPVMVNTWVQWPLFMAGIETDDSIHRDWIMNKLKGCKLSQVLPIILLNQRCSLKESPISFIRDQCSKT